MTWWQKVQKFLVAMELEGSFTKGHLYILSYAISVHSTFSNSILWQFIFNTGSRLLGQYSNLAMEWKTKKSEFGSWQGQKIFLSSTAPRLALGHIQSSIQWIPATFSTEIKQPEHQADQSTPFHAKVTNVWGYTPLPHTSSLCGA